MPDTSFSIMSTYATEDLLRIVTKNKKNYSTQELNEAMNELRLRNVDTNNLVVELVRLTDVKTTKNKEGKGEVRMNIYMKILTFFLPFILTGVFNIIESLLGISNSLVNAVIIFIVLLLLLIWVYYYIKKAGYIKMAKQFRTLIIASFIVSIMLLFLEYILVANS